MKTGILTFHRAHSYGAVLQCYALMKVLEKKGHDVEIIDYRQPYIERRYSLRQVSLLTRAWNYNFFVNVLRIVKRTLTGGHVFRKFRHRYLKTGQSFKGNNIPDYDMYVIGSDQVWSSECTQGFDLTYFGEFARPKKSVLIGYSVSTTVKSLSEMDGKEINRYLMSFNRISFREKSIAGIASQVSGKDFPVTLDPTLLLDADEWREMSGDCHEGNVVLYILPRSCPWLLDKMRKRGRELAWRLGCGMTEIKRFNMNVENFVRTIASAKAVVTNSFHGVTFTVIFRRPLYAVSLGDTLDDRYVSLLKRIGADSHIVSPDFDTKVIKDRFILNEQQLKSLREESFNFIPEA